MGINGEYLDKLRKEALEGDEALEHLLERVSGDRPPSQHTADFLVKWHMAKSLSQVAILLAGMAEADDVKPS